MSDQIAGEREQIDPGQPAGKSEGLEDAGSLPCCRSPRRQITRASLLADLAATTAADAKVIWNRALNGGAA